MDKNSAMTPYVIDLQMNTPRTHGIFKLNNSDLLTQIFMIDLVYDHANQFGNQALKGKCLQEFRDAYNRFQLLIL